jgi:hypothetical protein
VFDRRDASPDRSRSSFPWVGIVRIADAPCNRADMDIAVIDVPAVVDFAVAAAVEFGGCHAPIEARSGAQGKRPIHSRPASRRYMLTVNMPPFFFVSTQFK